MWSDDEGDWSLHEPTARKAEAVRSLASAESAESAEATRPSSRRRRLVLLISALASVCVALAAVLDWWREDRSPHFLHQLFTTDASSNLPIDLLPLPRSPSPLLSRRLDTGQFNSLAVLYASGVSASRLPDVASLLSSSASTVALLRCLDAATPSLRRLAVVSSSTSTASAVSLSLALRNTHWCVLVVGMAATSTFIASIQPALVSFRLLPEALHESLHAPVTGGVEEASRLSQRLHYMSAAELSQLPYSISSSLPHAQRPSLLQAKTVAYILGMHAEVDVLYDTEDGAPVFHSSDLPAMYTSHTLPTVEIRHRTAFNHTLPLPTDEQRTLRRTSNISSVQLSVTDAAAVSDTYSVRAVMLNPYPVMGHYDLWPRGFPTTQALRSIGQLDSGRTPTDAHQRFQHCLPAIQQLVPEKRGTADMDQYGRRQASGSRRFGKHESRDFNRLSVPFHSYSPVGAQSSVWLSSALPSLLLPPTLHPRVADIWRSYIAETLLSYGRVNNRPFNQSQHADNRSADETGPDGVSVMTADIEPCVAFVRASALGGASFSRAADAAERPFTDEAERLVAFLTMRLHGQPFDLLTRARQRVQAQQYGELTQLHLLAELYVDLYEAGMLECDDVQAAIAWVTDVLRIAAVREAHSAECPRRQDEFATPPFIEPLPAHFLPSLPHRQRAMAVCINFNWPPGDNTLWQLLRYHSAMHDSLALVLPVNVSQLSPQAQHWLTTLYPQVGVLYAPDQIVGRCQQFSLVRCLEWANSSGVLADADAQGVLYTADDIWFDFHEALYASPPQPDALPTFTSTNLSATHLTYPLDEFWYPLPVMEFNMSWPEQFISDWDWMRNPEMPYFVFLRHAWQTWPQQWRDLLQSVTGVPDSIVTNAVADMVYVPRSHGQFHTLLRVMHHTLYEMEQHPGGCIFSEVFLTQLIHLSMLLSGVRPAIPLPSQGANYDRQYETMYFGNPRNATTFYAQLHHYLTSPPARPNLVPLPPPHEARVRPVPLRIDGYRWMRDDWRWMRDRLVGGDGDPIFLHPVKLGGEAGGIVHESYVLSTERMMRQMDEARRVQGRKARVGGSANGATLTGATGQSDISAATPLPSDVLAPLSTPTSPPSSVSMTSSAASSAVAATFSPFSTSAAVSTSVTGTSLTGVSSSASEPSNTNSSGSTGSSASSSGSSPGSTGSGVGSR